MENEKYIELINSEDKNFNKILNKNIKYLNKFHAFNLLNDHKYENKFNFIFNKLSDKLDNFQLYNLLQNVMNDSNKYKIIINKYYDKFDKYQIFNLIKMLDKNTDIKKIIPKLDKYQSFIILKDKNIKLNKKEYNILYEKLDSIQKELI